MMNMIIDVIERYNTHTAILRLPLLLIIMYKKNGLLQLYTFNVCMSKLICNTYY